MRTLPTAPELIAVVADALRDGTLPPGSFQSRVAANALRIAQREAELAAEIDAAIVRRLTQILGRSGTAAKLEQALARRMAQGQITLETPGLADHLWQTTLAEMSVDQPGYATYRAVT